MKLKHILTEADTFGSNPNIGGDTEAGIDNAFDELEQELQELKILLKLRSLQIYYIM